MNKSERVAIIDLGSNSARLVILDLSPENAYHLVFHKKEGVRLCEGMHSDNKIQSFAWQRALAALQTFARLCKLFEVQTIHAVATAAARNACNGSDFIADVKKQTGLPIKIIDGDEEAYLGYLGVVNTIKLRNALIFDLGGGSTELILVKDKLVQNLTSMPFGAVTLNEIFNLTNTNDNKIAQAFEFIDKQLAAIPWLKSVYGEQIPIIGIGGTTRNIAKLDQLHKKYPLPKVHNYQISAADFFTLWESLANYSTLKYHPQTTRINTGRADIIVSGAAIIHRLFTHINSPNITVSGCGLREGIFCRHITQKSNLPEMYPNILQSSIYNLLSYYNSDITHAKLVTRFALLFFDHWHNVHQLKPHFRRIIYTAAMLHDLGIAINYYDHPRHSAYVIENANLFGLTHREQLMVAVIAGSHERTFRKIKRNKLYNDFFSGSDWYVIDKLSSLLAIAEALELDKEGKDRHVSVRADKYQATINLGGNATTTVVLNELQKCSFTFRKSMNCPLKILINDKEHNPNHVY